MIKLKYKGPYEGEYWEFPTYREIVYVRNGQCEVQFEETAKMLEMHGFERIKEEVKEAPAQVSEPPPPPPPILSSKERKVLEMYKNGDASISMISKSLRISRKKVESILETYKDYLIKEED